MAKQAELNNRMRKKSSQREIRPIWNNVQRVNHKNQFVPTAVLTRTGKIPVSTARASGTNNVSTARHNFNSQAVLTNAARKISTVKPFVNRVRPKTVFHKTHSPFRRPFNNTTTLRTNFSKQKVNTAEVNAVSAVGGKRETVVKPSTGPQEANQNAGKEDIIDAVKRSTTKDVGEEPTKHPDFKKIDEEDQVFLDELERLKRQEQDANDAAEALRKEFAQETEDLLLQAGAAKTHTKQKILKKFDFVSVKTASTPIETQKPLVKDEEAVDVEYTLYIHKWFFNVTPKTSHLSVVKRIFRYLKGKPKLGLWYPRVSLFDLEAYSDSKLWLGAKLTGNPQQEVVNFLAGDLFLGNAKSRQLWLLLTIRGRNMLLLCAKLL
ncbi:hypothetical protein Tco_0878325 [Tanacetum coccineum]|uniref:Uncharacterized protein n=1 Tax=Tanacetum coccineum TaxID=301880 RepID=A0ABQ5C2Y3_9ASTR